MSIETMAVVLHHSRARGTDKLVLLGIANHDGDGGAWPSIATLATYANVKERAVQKSIAALVALGELQVEIQQGGPRNADDRYRPNRYTVLVECPPECGGGRTHRMPRQGCPVGHPSTLPRGVQEDNSGVSTSATQGCPTGHPNRPLNLPKLNQPSASGTPDGARPDPEPRRDWRAEDYVGFTALLRHALLSDDAWLRHDLDLTEDSVDLVDYRAVYRIACASVDWPGRLLGHLCETNPDCPENAVLAWVTRLPGVSEHLNLRPDDDALFPTGPPPAPAINGKPAATSVGEVRGFAEFYAAYPRKAGRRKAAAEYAKALRRATPGEILAAAEAYAADPNRDPQFTAHPSTWLHQDRWKDGPLPARHGGSSIIAANHVEDPDNFSFLGDGR